MGDSDSANALRWLHLSDLTISVRGSLLTQDDFRLAFERDLADMHDESGPWDLVAITGDVTLHAAAKEYANASQILEELWAYLASLGSRPSLLVVPGNHDRGTRPVGSGVADWSQRLVPEAKELYYAEFTEWCMALKLGNGAMQPLIPGQVPGDFITGLRCGDLRVGFVGVNSDHIYDEQAARFVVAAERVAEAAGGDLRAWTQDLDAVVLLAHHGPARWLQGPESLASTWSAVPVIALAGGKTQSTPVLTPTAAPAAWLQGYHLERGASPSRCGYMTGALRLSPLGLDLQVRPRLWHATDGGFHDVREATPNRVGTALRVRWAAVGYDHHGAPEVSATMPARALIEWRSSDGRMRATADTRRLRIDESNGESWEIPFGRVLAALALSPRGTHLLVRAEDRVTVVDVARRQIVADVAALASRQALIEWIVDDVFAYDDPFGVTVRTVRPGPAIRFELARGTRLRELRSLRASPAAGRLACGTDEGLVLLDLGHDQDQPPKELRTGAAVSALAWSTDGSLLAVGHRAAVLVVDTDLTIMARLEGWSAALEQVKFSADGALLECQSVRGERLVWQVSDWSQVSSTPSGDVPVSTSRSVTAKVVLLGEGNAGKSSLAMRLAQGRFAELGATHAMQFWPVTAAALDPSQEHPPGERREVMLWDMGGQDEYRLLHRAFLRDTTVAVFVIEPRRGAVAFGELDAWMSQLRDRAGVVKLLVGSKLDDDGCPRDRPRAEALVSNQTFREYLETSAKTPLGIEALGAAIARAIDWGQLGVTVRSALFQRIRDYVTVRRESGRNVIPYLELEDIVRQREGTSFDRRAVDVVVEQMDRQGVISDQRLSDGTRMLVLDVSHVERYAGSLILAARDNPRGVPAIDRATVTAPDMVFPRIPTEKRLPRDQELVILEAVITTLIEHGICFPSSGMLVFPSLFRALDGSAPPPAGVSTRFDFVGAVDTPYAALVSSLAMSRGFGPVRLWADQAEFASPAGMCGLRRAGSIEQRRRGEGRLEIFFSPDTTPEVRQMFVGVLEELLRSMGVEISEQAEVACGCGHRFGAEVVRARLERGDHDVSCPIDEQRVPLAPPPSDGTLGQRVRAFRTETEQKRSQSVSEAKAGVRDARKDSDMARPTRILHLSDLHIGAGDDVVALLQPLLADLRDTGDGLGDRLDYVVVSGDLTNIASPEELSNARAFVEALIAETGISSERCVVVPGNHDLSWNVPVYDWTAARNVARPDPVTHVAQGKGFLVRNAATYAQRFSAFSEHFFHPLFQRPYLLEPERQGGATLFDEHALQFLTFNSAWHIDEWFPARSGLHAGAVSRTLMEADDAVRKSREAGRLAADARVLRLAVWHHPLTGNEKIQDDAFAEQLRKAGVTACLHGHVHEDRADLVGYWHPTRKLHVIGAGSFGAPARHRPESTPQLYNVLEVAPDRSVIKVHTRAKRRGPGAWGPWAVWETANAGERRAWYEIPLRS